MALSDYQRVEYIRGVTNAYINTGYKPTRNTQFDFTIGFTSLSGTQYFYGTYDGTRTYSLRVTGMGATTWRYASNSDTSVGTLSVGEPAPVPRTQPVKYHVEQTVDASAGVDLTITNIDNPTETFTKHKSYPSASTAEKNLYIMGYNQNGSVNYTCGVNTYLYGFTIKNSSGEAIYDYVPVREKNSTKAGLYDIVNDTVKWSANTSYNFTAGPDVAETSIYVKVLESITDLTGTTWTINSIPVLPDSSTSMYSLSFVTGENWDINCTRLQMSSTIIEYYSGSYSTVYNSNSGWSSVWYRNISITGGTSATSSDLIDWLLNNATLINGNYVWKKGVPYVNVNGTWKKGIAYVNVNGTWKAGI